MLQVTLYPEDQSVVEAQLRTGKYSDASAVIHQALNLLHTTPSSVDELRTMVAVGIEQLDRGESAPWDADNIKGRLREKFGSTEA